MPGVLIIEALAQVGAVTMLSMPENKGKIGLFGGIKTPASAARSPPATYWSWSAPF